MHIPLSVSPGSFLKEKLHQMPRFTAVQVQKQPSFYLLCKVLTQAISRQSMNVFVPNFCVKEQCFPVILYQQLG